MELQVAIGDQAWECLVGAFPVQPRRSVKSMDDSICLKPIDRQVWDGLASSFNDLSYRQCGAYAEIAAHDTASTAEFFAFYRADELIGLASVRVKKVPLLPYGFAYLDSGPLTAREDSFSAELFGSCLDALTREFVVRRRLFLRIVPPHRAGRWSDDQAACLKTHGFQHSVWLDPSETLVLDLSRPLDEIHGSFDANYRRHLSKARRSNLEITRSDSLVDFDIFEPIFLDLVRKKGFKTRRGVSFFRRFQEKAHPDQRLVLHLAWHKGEPIAGHLGSFIGDMAVFLVGASNLTGRKFRASYLLHWAVIKHAKSSGNLFYDLGGIDLKKNSTVYTFKKRLSSRRVVERSYDLAQNPLTKQCVQILEFGYNKIRESIFSVRFFLPLIVQIVIQVQKEIIIIPA
jgi:lipid II:glycine glycyltransferase (peptidoglycan interpeptide bridge formation enzyme)